jgi:hypothetical protein
MNRNFTAQEREQVAKIQLLAQQSSLYAAHFLPKPSVQIPLFDDIEIIPQKNKSNPLDADIKHSTYETCQRLIINNLPECRQPFKIQNRQPTEIETNRYQQALQRYRQHKRIKETILEAKNVFLTGKEKNKQGIRGACGRTASLNKMLKLKSIVEHWIQKGANPADLLYELENHQQIQKRPF